MQCAQAGSGKATEKGVVVSVSQCRGTASQRWRLVPKGDVFELTAVSSGKCLDVKDRSTKDGARVQQQGCAGTDNQLFSLRPVALGSHLVARNSGKCVAVAPGNPKGAALIQVACTQDPAQTWNVQRSIYQ
jgi:hypothetical protein